MMMSSGSTIEVAESIYSDESWAKEGQNLTTRPMFLPAMTSYPMKNNSLKIHSFIQPIAKHDNSSSCDRLSVNIALIMLILQPRAIGTVRAATSR